MLMRRATARASTRNRFNTQGPSSCASPGATGSTRLGTIALPRVGRVVVRVGAALLPAWERLGWARRAGADGVTDLEPKALSDGFGPVLTWVDTTGRVVGDEPSHPVVDALRRKAPNAPARHVTTRRA